MCIIESKPKTSVCFGQFQSITFWSSYLAVIKFDHVNVSKSVSTVPPWPQSKLCEINFIHVIKETVNLLYLQIPDHLDKSKGDKYQKKEVETWESHSKPMEWNFYMGS